MNEPRIQNPKRILEKKAITFRIYVAVGCLKNYFPQSI